MVAVVDPGLLRLTPVRKRWLTAAEVALNADLTGVDGYTVRQLIEAGQLAYSGETIRITFAAHSGRVLALNEVYTAHAAASGDAYDYIGPPTEITFNGGQTGFSIAAGQTIVSDEIAFAFDRTRNFVIGMDVPNFGTNGMRTIIGAMGWNAYAYVGNDAQTVNTTSYSTAAPGGLGRASGISKIEVFGRS